MNDDRDLGRAIASAYEETAPSREPRGLLDDVLLVTSRTRQRPSWLALIKEPPMRTSSNLAVGSPTVRVAAIMVATLLLAILVAGAGVAGSRLFAADGTIVVDQSGNGTTTTITEAVAMAADGDTILVRPGIYDESIVLAKDVTIRGDGDRDSVIVELSAEIPLGASGDGPNLPVAFLFEGSDATLENMTIRGESARIVINGGAPILQDLVLDGIGRVYSLDPGQPTPTGVNFNDSSTATVANTVFFDTDVDIETGSSPSLLDNAFTIGAIWMQGTGVNPVIRGNDIVDSGKWGISVGGGAQPIIEANTIANAANAIDIAEGGWLIPDSGTDPLIRDNTISGSSSTGILVGPGATATITNNELADNGVGMSIRSDALVEGNRVQGGSTGIYISGESPSLIDNGVEGASRTGIWVVGSASPTLAGNTVCNNGENLKVDDSATPDVDDTNEICEDGLAEASE